MSPAIHPAPSTRSVAAAVDRAVRFLSERQLPHGEIPVRRFDDPAPAGEGELDSSPFGTGLALLALDLASHPLVAGIRRRAEAFLLSEREPPGVWRYWSSRSGSVIDPDLDDTACISFALGGVAGRAGGNVAAILANRHPSGLFKTWLRDPEADNDVDGVVNANVLLYLGERPETIAARDIVCAAINEDREAHATSYYLDPLALYHAVARAHAHGVAGLSACREAVLSKVGAPRGPVDALAAALRISTRLGFGVPGPAVDDDVRLLLASQLPGGGFARSVFYAGPEPPAPHAVWWGSEELTTVFCVEALARHLASRGGQ